MKLFLLGLLFIFFFPLSFAFNVCSVDFSSQGANFMTPSGDRVFYLDGDGDVLIPSKKSSTHNSNSLQWFYDSNNLVLGTQNSVFSDVSPNVGSLTISGEGFIFRDSSQNPLVYISKSGDIQSRGNILYDQMGRPSSEDNPASCNPDGVEYCANSNRVGSNGFTAETPSVVKGVNAHSEDRNYYCDVNSESSGSCTYDVVGGESCYFEPYTTCSGNTKQWIEPSCSSGSCGSYVENTQNCGSDLCVSGYTDYYDCNCEEVCTGEGENEVCTTTCDTCSTYVCTLYNHRGCTSGDCYSYYE